MPPGSQQPPAADPPKEEKPKGEKPNPLDAVRITDNQIGQRFRLHAPDEESRIRMGVIRKNCTALAQVIKDQTWNGPDQVEAIKCVRQAMFFANSSVVLRGK